jgi:allose kinase
LEAYACGHILRDIAEEAGVEVAHAFTSKGNAMFREKLERFVYDLACALSTSINLFHADVALIGGGIPDMTGFPRDAFAEIFYAHLRRPIPAETVKLVWGELGSRAALYGAPLCL